MRRAEPPRRSRQAWAIEVTLLSAGLFGSIFLLIAALASAVAG